MARCCTITGKSVLSGNTVSHAGNRVRRFFKPNIQTISFLSDVLGRIRMKVSTQGIRLVESKGGIDPFLRETPDVKLTPKALSLKLRLKKKERNKDLLKKTFVDKTFVEHL